MDKEKVREWLSKLAANYKEQRELSVFGDDVFSVCFPEIGVQLYHCAGKIAEVLELPCSVRIVESEAGRKNMKISFEYDGVEFFGLERYSDA